MSTYLERHLSTTGRKPMLLAATTLCRRRRVPATEVSAAARNLVRPEVVMPMPARLPERRAGRHDRIRQQRAAQPVERARHRPVALAAIWLLAIPYYSFAANNPVGAADIVYRSGDKLCVGLSVGTPLGSGDYSTWGGLTPTARVGLGLGAASLSAGASLIAPGLANLDLHLAALETFGTSDWHSGTWVGPQLSLTALIFRAEVGRLQRLGRNHEARNQFGGGFAIPF